MLSPVLEVRELSVSFRQYQKASARVTLPVIDRLSLSVRKREVVAVIGASGSGKSLLAHAVMGLLPYNAQRQGGIYWNGALLDAQKQEKLRGRQMVLVPQNISYLDPLMKVGKQVALGRKDRATKQKVMSLLEKYHLEQSVVNAYPFELSGGMARRVLLCMAEMADPELVIADEPTSGLHRQSALQVLCHFREFADRGMGVLLITHDLDTALQFADRVVVFYAGTSIEETSADAFQTGKGLFHPYSKALRDAMPQHGFRPSDGTQPYPGEIRQGCLYAPRCERALPECRNGDITDTKTGNGYVRCLCPEGGAVL